MNTQAMEDLLRDHERVGPGELERQIQGVGDTMGLPGVFRVLLKMAGPR